MTTRIYQQADYERSKRFQMKMFQCFFIYIGFIDIQSTFGVLNQMECLIKNQICLQLRYINSRTMWDPKDVKFQILHCVLIFICFIDIQSSFVVHWEKFGMLSQKTNLLTTRIYQQKNYVRSQRYQIPNFAMFFNFYWFHCHPIIICSAFWSA